jgi:S1-C subfamily serine protease
VNLVLGDDRSLGLTIRGGAEYGLGIYITGVDPGSEAESSGLKVRDTWAPAVLVGMGKQGPVRVALYNQS